MTDSIKAIVSEMRDENRIRCLADGDYFSEFDVEEWASRLEALDATAAPVVVGEDMVERACRVAYEHDNDDTTWAEAIAHPKTSNAVKGFREAMRVALAAALAGD